MTRRKRLEERFLDELRELGVGGAPAHLLVAVSGGCDSISLLHLLRFAARDLPLALSVAHLDHAMRPGSEADARWLAGVCAAWGVPLHVERLSEPPAGEAAARGARYAFLRRTAAAVGAGHIVTAHQADDQAETVLFRVLRGTGIAGLRGIPARTRSGLLRPLLPFWREELEEYARESGLRWRTDPTNRAPDPARNRIRLHLLPEIERHLAPAARRNLVALAALAREAEAGWRARVRRAARVVVRREGAAYLLARVRLRDYDFAVGSRILRTLLRRFGIVLGRTGTRSALQFITHAPSGRELHLPDGVRVRLEFDTARIERVSPPAPDQPLVLDAPGPRGDGALCVGGRRYRAAWRLDGWSGEASSPDPWSVALDAAALHLPLQLRGWQPGDRVRTPGGTKTLKKLFLERRVPRSRRARLPVLVDAAGAVLWVAGLGLAPLPALRPGGEALFLTIVND